MQHTFHRYYNSPLNAPPCGRSTDGSNVRPKSGRNSSPAAECNSRSDANRACWRLRASGKLSRYASLDRAAPETERRRQTPTPACRFCKWCL